MIAACQSSCALSASLPAAQHDPAPTRPFNPPPPQVSLGPYAGVCYLKLADVACFIISCTARQHLCLSPSYTKLHQPNPY
jgi:hypothetical protein